MTITPALRARVKTALWLAPAALLLTLKAPPWLFAALAWALMLAALAEWRRLAGGTGRAAAALVGAASTAAALGLGLAGGGLGLAGEWWLAGGGLWLMCLVAVAYWGWRAVDLGRPGRRDATGQPGAGDATGQRGFGGLGGLIQGGGVVLGAWCALTLMRAEHGGAAAAAMLVVIWSADTCAYVVGKGFGRRRLAPAVSPGKTVEGLLGGVFGAVAVAAAAAVFVLDLNLAHTLMWMLAALLAALFGVLGDLHESRLKRRAGVKDSGALLPGHGGILDRIDGLLAAAPAFALVWHWAA